MKFVITVLFILSATNVYAHDYYDISHGERHYCTPEPEEDVPVTCVPNCRHRRENGECLQYHSDFCGRNPSCVPNCGVRRENGDCLQYKSDVCSES
jgi:hypothetical protein